MAHIGVNHETQCPRDEWIERLTSTGGRRDAALEELRGILVRGLSRALANLGDEAFAEDMAQEALLKILDSLDTFAGKSRFTTWAMAIAVRLGISESRRRRFRDVSLDSLTRGEGLKFEVPADSADTADQQSERQFVLAKLRALIAQELSEKQRTALHAGLSGMPVEEIARRTGSNRNAVYKLVHDARRKLKQGLEAEGVTASDIQDLFA